MWAAIAGVAQIAAATWPATSAPVTRLVLQALGYGLILPSIAVWHSRHSSVRESGTVLATIGGTTVVAVGIAASANDALVPAALFVLGMWWWTIGKMWWETATTHRGLGAATMAAAVLAILAAFLEIPLGIHPLLRVGMHAALGIWLLAVAGSLLHASRSP